MAKNSKMSLKSVAGQKATDFALNQAIDEDGNPTPAFQTAVLKALDIQRPLVLMNLNRLRKKHPDETPAQLADRLTKQYLLSVTGGGAAVGGTAVVPGIGTVAALGLSAAATVGFLEASALYAQSIAELHGITTDDPDRAQALVMAVMLGEDGRKMIKEFANQGRGGLNSLTGPGPASGVAAVFTGSAGVSEVLFQQLRRSFFRKILVRQGAGFLGRLIPFGVGAVIGGVGNRAMGKAVVKSAQNLFGPAPVQLPEELRGELKELPEGKEARQEARQLVRQGVKDDAEDMAAEVRAARERHRAERGES